MPLGLQNVAPPTQPVRFPKAEGYNLRIGARWFRTVAGPQAQIQIGTRDSLAERQDRAGSIYENVLDIGYAWARTDLSGGEGLDWDPRELALERDQAALDPIRYWNSLGIDVSRPDVAGKQYALRLARQSVLWQGTLVEPKDLGASNSFIYIADGDTVSWYSSWSDTVEVGSEVPSAGDNIRAIAVAPNDSVLATCDDGKAYIKTSDSAVFVEAYKDNGGNNLEAQGCWWVNGRFIISTFDNINVAELLPIEWNGTDWQPDSDIDSASSPFWSVVESGPAVVAACGDGTVRSYTPDNSAAGTFELIPRARTTMPEGETPILLGANAGVLLIMTTGDLEGLEQQNIRMYQAEVLDQRFDYSIGQLQLRREWQGATHDGRVVRNMTKTRDEIFWYVNESLDGVLSESLWRMDVVTGGFSRVVSDPGVDLTGLTVFDGKVGGIDFANSEIHIADDTRHQTFGYMIFPNITFGLNTPITWLATVLEAHDLIDTGAQVELFRSSSPQAILDWQDPSWVLVQRISSQAGSNIEIPLVNLKSRTLSLQLRIAATQNTTKSPAVTRLAIRGIPSHRDFMMMVPVNVSDTVSVPGRAPNQVPGLGNQLHAEMLSLVGENIEAVLIDPPVLFRGIVNNVSEPIEYLSERGSVTRFCMVELRGTRLTTTEVATGDDGFGLGLLGVSTLGIGQSEQI